MKKRFVIAVPALALLLATGVAPMAAKGRARSAGPPVVNPDAAAVCDAVRVFPRAGFASRLLGGEIQGSNESATGGFVTLARVTEAPREGQWTRIPLKNAKRYRFLRYFGPAGSYANIAEIEFLSGDRKIDGRSYGTFGSRDNTGNDFHKALDGNTKTFFDAAAPNAQYLGIEIKSGATSGTPAARPVVAGRGLRHYHIGNSLTDGMGDYTRELALAAGYKDDWADRQTIPGSPLYINYKAASGFGTPYPEAFVKFAPISDLVLQTFISNGDSEDPEFSLKFYDDARVKSPDIRPWIYGQWDATGSGSKDSGSPSWEARNRALMRIYLAHSLNFNAATKGRKSEVIPGGLALINLKKAIEAGKIPGLTNFFSTNFSDDLHLTEAGRQFIGMVIFSSLYNRSPVGLPIVKINDNAPAITPAQNKAYQQIAWDTVQRFRRDGGASLAAAVPGEIDALSYIRGDVPVRHSRLGNIDADRSFLYLLDAPRAGKYAFKVSATAGGTTEQKLNVFVNHRAAGSVTIRPGKDRLPSDSTAAAIDLKAGLNLLRLHVPVGRSYDLNSIKITSGNRPLKNTLPLFDLSAWDEEVKAGETSFVRLFRVHDAETPAARLMVSGTSDSTTLVPDDDIKIESGEFKGQWGEAYNRRLTVTPAAGRKGDAWITLTLSDAVGAKRHQTFRLKVK